MPELLDHITTRARPAGLVIMGIAPQTNGACILLGTTPDFWPEFTSAPEYSDGLPDPLDRWSKRIIGGLAHDISARCAFPSDGPPYPPFIGWALSSGRFHNSPIGLLTHDAQGMMFSLRGALLVEQALPETTPQVPCATCTKPCETACPVGALTPGTPYDVAACHAYLDTAEGQDCMTKGCAARRACPLSAFRSYAQSAFHMQAFHPIGANT